MNKNNDHVRKFLGVTAWHKAGYTGKRCTVFTGEQFEGSKADDHGKETCAALLEIAPDANVKHVEFPEDPRKIMNFTKAVEKEKASAMFYSYSTTYFNQINNLDAVMPERMFVAVSAGNDGKKDYSRYMKPNSVYGVGAIKIYWSNYNDDNLPAEGAVPMPTIMDYTSESDLVDFAAPTGLVVLDNGFLGGTSCACPVLVGMATLVNDFFIDKTGKPLTHNAMYQFLKDCAQDVHKKGEDARTGWGVPILPEPKTIDIKKYQKTYARERR